MKKYNEHFLMDVNTVKQYVIDSLDYFEDRENLVAEEIGDGNINYVFKVYDKLTKKSLVVKQADKLLRSSGRPLDLNRNKIEAEILKIESELALGFVPKIYDYNENMYALIMEDISEFKN
ncbi:S-methyl-5-thioribose kinase, partial [Helcococcus ovis]